METTGGITDWEQEARLVRNLSASLLHERKTLDREQKDLKAASKLLEDCQKAQEVLQLCAQAIQQKAHQKISSVVTSCLEAVFGESSYEFHIVFDRKRGKTEAQLTFRRNGEDYDPMRSTGGGVVDVAAFALRVSCLVLHRPRLSKVLVMDEPFKFVSEQYQENVKLMLEKLSKEMGIQILMVTHQNALATGKIIEIGS